MVSIREVAKEAQVSTATVSRTLTEPEKVSAATRAKVMRAIEKTGYVTNTLARNFRRRKTNTILVLVPDISNIFFSNIIQGIEETAHNNQYQILLGDTQYDSRREMHYASLVEQKQCDGIISLGRNIPFTVHSNSKKPDPAWPPFVMACEYNKHVSVPTVGIDNYSAALDAVNYLIKIGHRKIAYINGPTESPLCIDRSSGYRAALKAAGIAYQPQYESQGNFSIISGVRGMEYLLNQSDRPTAVFAANDEMAIGAINAIKAAGLSVPDDISVIGFDDIHFAEFADPPLTTIHQPRNKIGEHVMQLMLSILEGETPKNPRLILQHRLILRKSCKAYQT